MHSEHRLLITFFTHCLFFFLINSSFAYYIVTSQEYVVASVEKRMILSKFWKLVNAQQFDIGKYRMLRADLQKVERQISKLRQAY